LRFKRLHQISKKISRHYKLVIIYTGNWEKYERQSDLKPTEYEKTIFHLMYEENEKKLLKLMENPSMDDKVYEAKVKDFYHSCTDEWSK